MDEAYCYEGCLKEGDSVDTSMYDEYSGALGYDIEPQSFNRGSVMWDSVRQLIAGKETFRIALPPVLIEPMSHLERMCRNSDPTVNLLKTSKEPSPAKRMLFVLEWVMLPLFVMPKDDHCHVKPFNPALGEVFRCKLREKENGDDVGYFHAEKVSDNPPVSAFFMKLEKSGITYLGTTFPSSKMKYAGNASSTHVYGIRTLEIDIDGETEVYQISIPNIYVKGLLFGGTAVFYTEELTISCERTGISARVEYKSKSQLRGSIKEGDQKICNINGHCHGVTLKREKGIDDDKFPETADLKYDNKLCPLNAVTLPLMKQKPNESRRYWHNVTINLLNRDFDEVIAVRDKILEHETANFEKMEEEDTKFEPKFYQEGDVEKFEWPPKIDVIQEFIEEMKNVLDAEDSESDSDSDEENSEDSSSGFESASDGEGGDSAE